MYIRNLCTYIQRLCMYIQRLRTEFFIGFDEHLSWIALIPKSFYLFLPFFKLDFQLLVLWSSRAVLLVFFLDFLGSGIAHR